MRRIINRSSFYIIFALLVFSAGITYVDAFVHPTYFLKIPIKILFFLVLPLLYFVFNREAFADFKALFKPKGKGLGLSLLLGLGIYAVITVGYFLTRDFFDFSAVTGTLEAGMGITKDNFLYVALYISVMNSFLEEFFFRGFGFIIMKKYTTRTFAYIFSPVLFAFYHAGMTLGMFDVLLTVIVMLGLVCGGIIFNFLNEKNENIYSSWFTHMFANFAINTVGFVLFSAK